MEIINTIEEMRRYASSRRNEAKSIGFVPTMGYLHAGHASLIKAARAECDIVVVSIFVNPTQFGPGEDLARYPRDIENDKNISETNEVDVLFIPGEKEMYPEGYSTFVGVEGSLSGTLCGASRPGHFRGVTTVVAKLFNIVRPDIAFFGRKDAQQAAIIERMVKDLDMDIEIRKLPIVREDDGLAMSSRNSYLSSSERRRALSIHRSLLKAKELISEGMKDVVLVREEMRKILEGQGDLDIDYIEIVSNDNFELLEKINGKVIVMVAAYLGKVRLIDNMEVAG